MENGSLIDEQNQYEDDSLCSGVSGLFLCISITLAVFVIVGLVCIFVYAYFNKTTKQKPKTLKSVKQKLDLNQLPASERVGEWMLDNTVKTIRTSKVQHEIANRNAATRDIVNELGHASSYNLSPKIKNLDVSVRNSSLVTSSTKNETSDRSERAFKSSKWKTTAKALSIAPSRSPSIPKEKRHQHDEFSLDTNDILERQVYLQNLGRFILNGGDPDHFDEKYKRKSKQFNQKVPENTILHPSPRKHSASSTKRPSARTVLEKEVERLLNPSTRQARASLDDVATQVGGSYQFHITGDQPGDWCIDMTSGRVKFRSGVIPHPDVTVTCDHKLAMKIIDRQVRIWPLVVTGKVKVEGNKAKMQQLKKLLKKIDDQQRAAKKRLHNNIM